LMNPTTWEIISCLSVGDRGRGGERGVREIFPQTCWNRNSQHFF
jgi:hypothetical protein